MRLSRCHSPIRWKSSAILRKTTMTIRNKALVNERWTEKNSSVA